MVLLPCGHTYCNRASSYASARVTECSKCQQAVAGAGGAVWRAGQTWRRCLLAQARARCATRHAGCVLI